MQDIPEKHNHSGFDKRKYRFAKDSEITRALGGGEDQETEIFLHGVCYHHQNIEKLAPNLRATSWDVEDGTIHSIEYKGCDRKIFGVLWHPEICINRAVDDSDFKNNSAIFKLFLEQAVKYKSSKYNFGC